MGLCDIIGFFQAPGCLFPEWRRSPQVWPPPRSPSGAPCGCRQALRRCWNSHLVGRRSRKCSHLISQWQLFPSRCFFPSPAFAPAFPALFFHCIIVAALRRPFSPNGLESPTIKYDFNFPLCAPSSGNKVLSVHSGMMSFPSMSYNDIIFCRHQSSAEANSLYSREVCRSFLCSSLMNQCGI